KPNLSRPTPAKKARTVFLSLRAGDHPVPRSCNRRGRRIARCDFWPGLGMARASASMAAKIGLRPLFQPAHPKHHEPPTVARPYYELAQLTTLKAIFAQPLEKVKALSAVNTTLSSASSSKALWSSAKRPAKEISSSSSSQ